MIYIYSYSLVERQFELFSFLIVQIGVVHLCGSLSVKFLFLMNKCSVVQMLGCMLVLFVCANVCGQLCHSALVDARGQLWGS